VVAPFNSLDMLQSFGVCGVVQRQLWAVDCMFVAVAFCGNRC